MKMLRKKNNSILSILIWFLFIYYPSRSLGISFTIGMGSLGILLLLNIVVRNESIQFSMLNKLYLLLCVILIVSYSMPYARHDIKTVGIQIATFAFLAFAVVSAKTSRIEIIKISKCLMYFGLLVSIYVILMKIFPEFYKNNILPNLRGLDYSEILQDMKKGYGVEIGGDSVYADYILTVASFIGIGFLMLSVKKMSKMKIIIFEIIYFIAIVLEGRRGELISYVISIIAFYTIIHRKNNRKQLLCILFFVIGLLLFGPIIISYLTPKQMITRYFNTFIRLKELLTDFNIETLSALMSGRSILWKEAYNRFISSPIIGIGWGRYHDYVPQPYTGKLSNVHNIWLQFLCETGIIGTILLSLPILGLFREAICAVKKNKTEKYSECADYLLASTAAFGIQCFFLIDNLLDPCFYKSTYVVLTVISIILLNYCKNIRKHSQIANKQCGDGV